MGDRIEIRTPDNEERSGVYIEQCRASDAVYGRYRQAGEDVLATSPRFYARFPTGRVETAVAIGRWRSALFEREHFIGWVPDEVFVPEYPHTDAAAEMNWRPGQERPPLVLVPVSRRRSRSVEFRSIIEHEIVHINQVLRGHDLRWAAGTCSADELLATFFAHSRLEFVANFVQLVRWPRPRLRASLNRWSITLEKWCLLRGYTQALEYLLFDMLLRRVEAAPTAISGFLDEVPRRVHHQLAGLHITETAVEWMVSRWKGDVGNALELTLTHKAQGTDASHLLPVRDWVLHGD